METKGQPEKIADRYEVIDTIGSGGVGTVYKAMDPLLNKEVAVKILKRNSDGNTAARLQREAMAAGKLNHPHICRIDNFGQTADGSPYMVMEYLKGQDLASQIKSSGALRLESALEIGIQVCCALSYAHKNGIVHRDLKPANVLLLNSKNDAVFTKLLDFGVASLESQKGDLTQAGAIIGSPLYMSPEQIKGEEVGPPSDIYSFGCMLFEMFTGEPPLKGNSIVETFALHKNAEAPSLSNYGNFPESLVSLISECLAKDPDNRPKNAGEVLTRLEKIQHDFLNPVTTSTSFNSEDAELKEKRKKRTILLSTITVGTLAALSLGFIIKDICTRKAIPETKVLRKCAMEDVPEVFFGDARNARDLFPPERDQSRGASLRAVPTVTDQDMKVLKGRKMYRLCMDGTPIDGSGLQYVLDSGLQNLSLGLTRVTDENTHYLTELKKLRTLNLKSDLLTDEGIKPLSGLSGLTFLTVDSDNITNGAISNFNKLVNLQYLHIGGKNLTADCLKNLNKPKKLHTLTLDGMAIKGDLSGALSEIPKLFALIFQEPLLLESESIKSLSNSTVNNLSFVNMKVSAEQFKAITSIQKVKRLCFNNVEFEGENFAGLKDMQSLGVLNMMNIKKFSNKTMEDISKNKRITDLEIVKSDFSEENLKTLLKHPGLRYLNLHDCFLLESDMIESFRAEYKSCWGRDLEIAY